MAKFLDGDMKRVTYSQTELTDYGNFNPFKARTIYFLMLRKSNEMKKLKVKRYQNAQQSLSYPYNFLK